MTVKHILGSVVAGCVLATAVASGAEFGPGHPGGRGICRDLPTYTQLKAALDAAVAADSTGLNTYQAPVGQVETPPLFAPEEGAK